MCVCVCVLCVCVCVCHKAAMATPTDHLSCDLQLLHLLEARVYRECAASMRRIGRDCIEKRIKAVATGGEVPNDILTQILQISCGCG